MYFVLQPRHTRSLFFERNVNERERSIKWPFCCWGERQLKISVCKCPLTTVLTVTIKFVFKALFFRFAQVSVFRCRNMIKIFHRPLSVITPVKAFLPVIWSTAWIKATIVTTVQTVLHKQWWLYVPCYMMHCEAENYYGTVNRVEDNLICCRLGDACKTFDRTAATSDDSDHPAKTRPI